MKKMIVLGLLMFSLVLVGCNENNERPILESPQNLVFDGLLRWDKVDNANEYEIHVDEEVIVSINNFYVFEHEGDYEVYVIAKASGYSNSNPSITLDITIDYENEVDFYFDFESNILTWTNIDDAINYNVFINGSKYETENSNFELSDIDPGILAITVQAVYPIGVSNISQVYYLDHDLSLADTINFQYSTNSSVDLIIWEDFDGPIYLMDLEGNFLNIEDVLNDDSQHLSILSSYVKQYNLNEEDSLLFYILNQKSKIPVEINITDKINPYIISSSVRTTNGNEDIHFQFELFDGEFYSINGGKDDEVLYDVNDSILTIKAEFISGKFNNSESFMLSYVINRNDNSVIGYLHFNQVN